MKTSSETLQLKADIWIWMKPNHNEAQKAKMAGIIPGFYSVELLSGISNLLYLILSLNRTQVSNCHDMHLLSKGGNIITENTGIGHTNPGLEHGCYVNYINVEQWVIITNALLIFDGGLTKTSLKLGHG